MTLGQMIQHYLDENEITVATFAAKCGYSIPTIYRFLRDQNTMGNPLSRPSMDSVMKIARGMGVAPQELLNAISSDFRPGVDILPTEDEKRLIEAFRRAPEALQQGIRDMLHV